MLVLAAVKVFFDALEPGLQDCTHLGPLVNFFLLTLLFEGCSLPARNFDVPFRISLRQTVSEGEGRSLCGRGSGRRAQFRSLAHVHLRGIQ